MTIDKLLPISLLRNLYSNGRKVALMFDYDGTLVPLAQHPQFARPSPRLLKLFDRFAQIPNVHLGVFSGRQLLDLRDLLPDQNIFMAGTSGLEIDFCGVTIVHPDSGSALPVLRWITERLNNLVEKYRGAWLEKKRVGLTLHFRDVSPFEINSLLRYAEAILNPHFRQLKIVNGALALEITPNLGWTKATAMRMFLESLQVSEPAMVYAGDGENDVDAMQFVADLGGITVGVGANACRLAQFRIMSPQTLLDWLACLELNLSNQILDDQFEN